MNLPRLIATDLDGTIVRSDETVSTFTHSVFERVRDAGIPIVGVTGRGPRLEALSRTDLPHADLLVLGQGGRVLDLRGAGGPRVLRDARVPGPVVAGIVSTLEGKLGRPVRLLLEVLDAPGAPLWGDEVDDWPYPDDLMVQARELSLTHDVIKAFVRAGPDTDGLLEVAAQVIPADVAEVTHSGLGWVEITPPNVDKGTGLAIVAAELGIKAEDVLVFGDMPNDIPMFKWAGWRRVAVENAHPALLALADEVTLSNERDGVAVYLDNLLKTGA